MTGQSLGGRGSGAARVASARAQGRSKWLQTTTGRLQIRAWEMSILRVAPEEMIRERRCLLPYTLLPLRCRYRIGPHAKEEVWKPYECHDTASYRLKRQE